MIKGSFNQSSFGTATVIPLQPSAVSTAFLRGLAPQSPMHPTLELSARSPMGEPVRLGSAIPQAKTADPLVTEGLLASL